MRKKKIKILHVAQAAGGVDRYIRMLLKYLDKEKFENILVCSQDFNREDYDGLVDSFEQIEMNRAIGVSDLNSIKEVRRLIKKYNPDIVYAHSSKAGAIARVADIGLKNHCVYNPHGWAFNMRCSDKKRAMYTAIEKMAAPFCEKISNNPSLNSVHQYTQQPFIHPPHHTHPEERIWAGRTPRVPDAPRIKHDKMKQFYMVDMRRKRW